MRKARKRLFSTLTVSACLFLIAGSASADRYKNESGKGKNEYKGEYHSEEYDYRGEGPYDSANNGWSVGGSWEGRRGGVDVHVYGGSNRYPSHGGHGPGYSHYRSRRIPPGHLPPPGECRVWFYDRPAGHQPPPTSCRQAERYARHYGGRVIFGGPSH